MKISVFGLGCVGVVSAACLARAGHRVIGVDINADKVRLIESGKSPIVEPDLGALTRDMVARGAFSATSDAADAIARTDISFICVGTPNNSAGVPFLAAIESVVREIGALIATKDSSHTVAIRSTVPPGTIEDRLVPILCQASGREFGKGWDICSNPEFLREGSAIRDFEHPPFLLIGSRGGQALAALETLYSGRDTPIVRTDIRTAESIKYLCNVFHAVKIGFSNEIGTVLKSLGVDSREAMRILCEDRFLNISSAYLRPGFAFGGSCLPRDLRAFLSIAEGQGVDLPFIGALLKSNRRHIDGAFDLIARGGRRKVALFGLAFKPGTDDLRESPFVALARKLIEAGFDVTIFDPLVSPPNLFGANREFIESELPQLDRLLKATAEETLEGAEIIVIGHAGPAETDIIRRRHQGRRIIDLQGAGDTRIWENADYEGICW